LGEIQIEKTRNNLTCTVPKIASRPLLLTSLLPLQRPNFVRYFSDFTHLDDKNQPTMVDIGDKKVSKRTAHARSIITLPPPLFSLLTGGEILAPKGPVFATAIIAGTMAAKKTHDIIPFCHPLPIEKCHISISCHDDMRVVIDVKVSVTHKTGVEMEALTAASVAALTVYDMCKAVSKDMVIEEIKLVMKTGGKSDYKDKDE
jgi:cyclic pyranopterin monophosphate synthase